MATSTPAKAPVAGPLAVAVAVETVAKLVNLGVISNDDALDIYSRTLYHFPQPQDEDEARAILTALMPGLEIIE
jgi:hypothetical protein